MRGRILSLVLFSWCAAIFAQDPAATPSPAPEPTPVPSPAPQVNLVVSLPEQKMALTADKRIIKTYKISTSRYGEGDSLGSWRTPTGRLEIADKIGARAASGSVFKGRHRTGEILLPNAPGRDPIISRIIWLRGLDTSNRNAYQRCIYIHGTPQEELLGRKASFGCIRMSSNDVIEVFNRVSIGTPVVIIDKPIKLAVKSLDNPELLAKSSNRTDSGHDFFR